MLGHAAMKSRPAIVVLACAPVPAAADSAVLAEALQARLPLVVVTTEARAGALADLVARRDIVVVSDAEAGRGAGHALARGVSERPGAPGWLALPAEGPPVRAATLIAVAAALAEHPVAVAEHRGRRGSPVAFGAELYSELVRLTGDDGLRRLVARYPAAGVAVDDAAVVGRGPAAESLRSAAS